MEIREDTFLPESRKSLCRKDLSGFYGFIRSYEIRSLSNDTEFHISLFSFEFVFFSQVLQRNIYIIVHENPFFNSNYRFYCGIFSFYQFLVGMVVGCMAGENLNEIMFEFPLVSSADPWYNKSNKFDLSRVAERLAQRRPATYPAGQGAKS